MGMTGEESQDSHTHLAMNPMTNLVGKSDFKLIFRYNFQLVLGQSCDN